MTEFSDATTQTEITSEMWCWSEKLYLCYSIVYYYNGAQRYEQLLQVGRLYRALILLALALCLPSASMSLVFMVLLLYRVGQKNCTPTSRQ